MGRLILAVCVFLLLIGKATAKDEAVIWLTDDKRDMERLSSTEPQTIGSDTLALLYHQLAKLNIQLQLTSIPRMNLLLEQMDNVCVVNRVRTPEREQVNLFSLPVNLYLGYRLYFLPENRPTNEKYIDGEGRLTSLPNYLIETETKTIGVAKGVSFGDVLDNEIEQIPSNHIFLRAGEERYTVLPQMLVKRRFDYVIDFPVNMKKRLEAHQKVDLASMEMSSSPAYILGHIACSRSAIGEAMIEKVNQALLNLYQTPEFYQAHLTHMADMDIAQFDRYFSLVFLSHQ